jgi:hypothetical protein
VQKQMHGLRLRQASAGQHVIIHGVTAASSSAALLSSCNSQRKTRVQSTSAQRPNNARQLADKQKPDELKLILFVQIGLDLTIALCFVLPLDFHSTSEAKSAQAALKMLTHRQGDHRSNRTRREREQRTQNASSPAADSWYAHRKIEKRQRNGEKNS